MALKLNERYPGRFTNPSADYPQGSFKNRTTPSSKDGSYLEKDWANDKEGFFQSLLYSSSTLANGAVDKVGDSQYYSSLWYIISNTGTEWSRIVGKPTTLSGYGISDAYDTSQTYNKSEVNIFLSAKAAKATTLSGYGITDAYTSTAVDGALAGKADKSTTLAGYNISVATQPEAEATTSVDNTKPMTSLRVQQSIAKRVLQATQSAPGIMAIATPTEAATGADNTKAITPSTLSGELSGALNKTLGYNRNYIDVTSSRVSGANYTNSSGAPIQVLISLNTLAGAETTTVFVNGVTIYTGDPGLSGQQAPITFIIPNGAVYAVTLSGTTFNKWVEPR